MIEPVVTQFIAQFNELDDYLEHVLNKYDQHMNFNHKLKVISKGAYPISHVIQQYFYDLNYLGELRNQLVHGITLDGEAYMIPTDHAIQQLREFSELIMKPISCTEVYAKQVYAMTLGDSLADVINLMNDHHINFVPVFDGAMYCMTVTEWTIMSLLGQYHDISVLTLSDVPRSETATVARFGQHHTILDIESYLLHHPRAVAYLTLDGQPSVQLVGIATEHDLVLHADLGLQHSA